MYVYVLPRQLFTSTCRGQMTSAQCYKILYTKQQHFDVSGLCLKFLWHRIFAIKNSLKYFCNVKTKWSETLNKMLFVIFPAILSNISPTTFWLYPLFKPATFSHCGFLLNDHVSNHTCDLHNSVLLTGISPINQPHPNQQNKLKKKQLRASRKSITLPSTSLYRLLEGAER